MSGGLLEFLWDADHQTLGRDARRSSAQKLHHNLDKTTGKGQPLCLLVFWNADSKADRNEQVGNRIENDRQPILQKQAWLSDETNPDWLVCISFSTSRKDAEEKDAEEDDRQYYDTITDMLKAVVESPAMLEILA